MSCREAWWDGWGHLLVVTTIENARHASNPDAPKLDHPSLTKVVDVGSHPTSVVELPKIVHGFVIASNCSTNPLASKVAVPLCTTISCVAEGM